MDRLPKSALTLVLISSVFAGISFIGCGSEKEQITPTVTPVIVATATKIPETKVLETSVAVASTEPAGTTLVFADEFNGSAVDQTNWVLADPFGKVRNEELQAYVSDAFSVSDGLLHISVTREPAKYDGAVRQYSSGMMTTNRLFEQQYGRFEIRCRVPAQTGLWPSMWLHPSSLRWPPEIDVFEVLGQDPTTAYFTNHWGASPAQHQQNQSKVSGVDFAADFHIFSVDWTQEGIVWSLDGKEVARSAAGVPSEPMFIMVNVAVGGSWQEPPDQSTTLPASLDVDYIRVYSR